MKTPIESIHEPPAMTYRSLDDVHHELVREPQRRADWKEFATYFVLAFLAFATFTCWLAAAIWGS